MEGTPVSTLVDRGLTPEEKIRFYRLRDLLFTTFAGAGRAVRVCAGHGEGAERRVDFLAGDAGAAVVSLPAEQFVSGTDDELLAAVKQGLST